MDDRVSIWFDETEKYLIHQYAGSVLTQAVSKQLCDRRRKHIEFEHWDLEQISGELSHAIKANGRMSIEVADHIDFICSELERHL
jgi:hypothetical protein